MHCRSLYGSSRTRGLVWLYSHGPTNALRDAADATGKKLALTVVTCLSSARSGVKRIPRIRTTSAPFTVSVPSVRLGSWLRRRLATLYLVPAHNSSVFSAFSFSRLADIQLPMAVTHCSSLITDITHRWDRNVRVAGCRLRKRAVWRRTLRQGQLGLLYQFFVVLISLYLRPDIWLERYPFSVLSYWSQERFCYVY